MVKTMVFKVMKCTVLDLDVMSSNPGQVEHLGCLVLLAKSYLNQKHNHCKPLVPLLAKSRPILPTKDYSLSGPLKRKISLKPNFHHRVV